MKAIEGFGQSVGSAVGGAAMGLGAIGESAGDHVVAKFKYAHGYEAAEVLRDFGQGSGHLGQAFGSVNNLVNPVALAVQTGGPACRRPTSAAAGCGHTSKASQPHAAPRRPGPSHCLVCHLP